MNRRLALPVVLVVAATLVSACGSDNGSAAKGDSGSKIQIVASTDVYGDIAGQIGGSDVAVTSILTNPEQDPHSFEANPRTTLAVSKADLLIENGGGYDDYMERLRNAQNKSAPILNAVQISGKTAPAGGELNEHIWYDLPSVEKIADAIASALGTKDPDHASDYRQRADDFNKKVGDLVDHEAQLKQALAGKPVAGRSIGITEPVPLYMTQALGLTNATPEEFSAAVEEGTDVPARVLAATLALYSDKKVGALVYNKQTTGPVSEKVVKAANDAGIPVVGVTETLPAGKDYLAWMTDNLDAIGAALGAS